MLAEANVSAARQAGTDRQPAQENHTLPPAAYLPFSFTGLPSYSGSLTTKVSEVTSVAARVVGMPSAHTAGGQ